MYTLRFPFRLPIGREIDITDSTANIGSLQVLLTTKGKYNVISISGFQTEVEAQRYKDNIHATLLWLLLEINEFYPVVDSLDLDNVVYCTAPTKGVQELFSAKPVDGIANENFPVVYQTGENIRFCGVGEPTLITSIPSNKLLAAVRNISSSLKVDNLIHNPELITALDLYGAYYVEKTDNARFITLINAMEALSPDIERPEPIKEYLKKLKQEINYKKKEYGDDSAEFKSLDSLLGNMKDTESIRRKTLCFIKKMLKDDDDVVEIAKKWDEIYSTRSTLLHEGYVEPRELRGKTQEAKRIVNRVLKTRFMQVMSKP